MSGEGERASDVPSIGETGRGDEGGREDASVPSMGEEGGGDEGRRDNARALGDDVTARSESSSSSESQGKT
jgi:hypothetical protein